MYIYYVSVTDPASLVQPVANSAQFSNARVKPIMINKLAGQYHTHGVRVYMYTLDHTLCG